MINKVYVSTSDASLIRSAQTVAIAQLGFLWIMGPVDKMRTVQEVPKSKWAYMVLDGNSGAIYTTNSGPAAGSRTSTVATSLTDITTTFTPTPPLSSPPAPPVPPPFVLSFVALINSNSSSAVSATAPVTAAFTGTHTYNGEGIVTGILDLGDGSSLIPYTSSAVVNHTYDTGSFTASLSLTESTYNSTSVATVYVTANVPTIIAQFSMNPTLSVAPFTSAFTNESTVSLGEGDSVLYNWFYGDGALVSTSLPGTNFFPHTYNTGTFVAQLQITESVYGITSVYVLPGGVTASVPTLTVSFTTNSIGFGDAPESYMEPVTISFTSSVSYTGHGGLTYLWDFGNLTSSSMEPPPQGNYTTGAYTASLTVTEGSYGIIGYSEQTFIVNS